MAARETTRDRMIQHLADRDRLRWELDSLRDHLLPTGDRIDLTDTVAVDKLASELQSALAEVHRLRRRKTRI